MGDVFKGLITRSQSRDNHDDPLAFQIIEEVEDVN